MSINKELQGDRIAIVDEKGVDSLHYLLSCIEGLHKQYCLHNIRSVLCMRNFVTVTMPLSFLLSEASGKG